MATIANFSMASLYVKDLNWINYAALTVFYYYFSKKIEQYLIGGDRASIDKSLDGASNISVAFRVCWNTLVFSDRIKIKKSKQEGWAQMVINYSLKFRNLICTLGVLFMILFHILIATIEPPKRLPDLFWVINNAFSFGFYVLMAVFAHCIMIAEAKQQ
ncbi:MAG: hypothetical protein ACMG6E_06400 [Candidatus Roizmanbacteria bacterium]